MAVLDEAFKSTVIEAAKELRGARRRLFMARVVRGLGDGGQRRAEAGLGWDRVTIRKGTHELGSGIACRDASRLRGRPRAEGRLPDLLADVKDVVTGQSQADPRFRTPRLYARLTADAPRRQLVDRKGYRDSDPPGARAARNKLDGLGSQLRKALKCQPKKS